MPARGDAQLKRRSRVFRPEHEALAQAAAVARVLVGADRVLISAHIDPDGDACGSSLGLALALREMGREVAVFAEQAYPDNFSWLPGVDMVRSSIGDDEVFDATVVVDAGRLDRLGAGMPKAEQRGTLCWVDHHRHPSPPGHVNYVDPTAPAVSEQVREILRVLDHTLSEDVSRCLYAALLTDTGSFRYANTTPRALSLASELVACGVSAWDMTERIYESQPPERLKLLARVLPSLEISACGQYATLIITQLDLRISGAKVEHTDGFINYPRSIAGVEVAVQLREQGQAIKVGFRSRGAVDVRQIAEGLGGGGHRNAAGCLLPGTLESVRPRVHQEIEAVLQRSS